VLDNPILISGGLPAYPRVRTSHAVERGWLLANHPHLRQDQDGEPVTARRPQRAQRQEDWPPGSWQAREHSSLLSSNKRAA